MKSKNLIQVITGWMMLLVFSLSITPKQYLHDVFAGHQDMAVTAKTSKETQVTKQGYHCECNNLVATSPFTTHESFKDIEAPVVYRVAVVNELSQGFTSFRFNSHGLRGPPAIV